MLWWRNSLSKKNADIFWQSISNNRNTNNERTIRFARNFANWRKSCCNEDERVIAQDNKRVVLLWQKGWSSDVNTVNRTPTRQTYLTEIRRLDCRSFYLLSQTQTDTPTHCSQTWMQHIEVIPILFCITLDTSQSPSQPKHEAQSKPTSIWYIVCKNLLDLIPICTKIIFCYFSIIILILCFDWYTKEIDEYFGKTIF